MKTKFYLCTTCGNVVVKAVNSGVNVHCCGKEMIELIPSTVDGLKEKHLPVIECVDECTIKVKIGSEPHPMTEDHFISFIYLETEHGGQMRCLKDCKDAEATFCVCNDKPTAVYCYCNLHGLWKTEIKNDFCNNGKGCRSSMRGC